MISVIIPVYNVERYLERCLESVRKQTYTDLEIILVDDGSTDRSYEICQKYHRMDARIKLYQQENQGASAARNYGLEQATGSYIGFVDADDWIEENMYERLFQVMQEEDAQISCCAFRWVEKDRIIDHATGEKKVYQDIEMFNTYITGKQGCMLSPAVWNRLYKREIFDGIRFTEGRMFEDKEMTCMTLVRCTRGVYINEALYNYVQHEESVSHGEITEKYIDDLIYMNRVQNQYVDRYLTEDGKIQARGIYYMILLDRYCKMFFRGKLEKARRQMYFELRENQTYGMEYLNRYVQCSRQDKCLLSISKISPNIYATIQKLKRIEKRN